jgi:16S rRNA (guanine527-N7)-methyltransferase
MFEPVDMRKCGLERIRASERAGRTTAAGRTVRGRHARTSAPASRTATRRTKRGRAAVRAARGDASARPGGAAALGRAGSSRGGRGEVSRFTVLGMASAIVESRLAALSERYGLPPEAAPRLAALLKLVATEPASITSVRDPENGVDVHVADSLVALEVPAVRAARRVADLGSGGGFPGLALAIALPSAHVALVESVRRKCHFLARAADALGLANVEVICERAEEWPAGLASQDVVTARALAPLGVLVEYAAPLLALGGTLVAWKGRIDEGESRDAAAAAAALAMEVPRQVRADPFPGADERYLHLSLKVGSTPKGYPRRPGMARKRPIRAST